MDFKAGDEVVCLRMDARPEMVGKRFTVREAFLHPYFNVWVVHLFEAESNRCPLYGWSGFLADRFRKVQRRDLTAWLKTAVDVPALDKRKVRA